MKKFLSLVLALVMTMSLVTVAGASFTDASSVNYDEAVDMISALEVVGGYTDGSFNPKGALTRQAAAKIICNINVGPDAAADLAAAAAPFADVAANNQFAGYIAYCANEGIISGYGDGNFGPANPLTGYAFLKMLLVTLGYDATIEGYVGTNAQVNILLDAKAAGLLKGFDGTFVPGKTVTREEAALFAFNALKAQMVGYSDKGSNITIGDIQISTGASSAEAKWDDDAKTDKTLLREVKFEDLQVVGTVSEDALGRPAHAWKIKGEKSNIGTYADVADLVINTKIAKEKDFKDLMEENDLDANSKVAYTDTAFGKTIELFADEDGKVTKAVAYAGEVVSAAAITYGKDKVSTKEDDERSVTFTTSAGAIKVVADADVVTGTELANFEELYAAAEDEDKDLKVLVVLNAAKNDIFSVEILEIVETPVSRVVKADNEIVAGGETYVLTDAALAKAATSKDDVKLYVAENGLVYDIAGIAPTTSDVIYLDAMLKDSTDKYNKVTKTAQIVNEDNEIVEIVVDKAYAAGFYTYDINDDDQYVLTAVTAKAADAAMDKDLNYVKFGGVKTYFAADFEVVFIDVANSGEKLAVSVKTGVQDKVVADHYVLNDDGDVAIAYVKAAYSDGESEDLIFLADTTADADVINLDGKAAKEYVAYIDGEEVQVMISNPAVGFYTYEIDEKTGEYKLVTAKNTYLKKTITITKDTYVSVGDIDDATVTGEIVDLTDEGLFTLKALADWDGAAVEVSFQYDKDENEITIMYVTAK